jgi:hypothetical protein
VFSCSEAIDGTNNVEDDGGSSVRTASSIDLEEGDDWPFDMWSKSEIHRTVTSEKYVLVLVYQNTRIITP